MNKFTLAIAATAIALSGTSFALASDSALDSLGSANSASFSTVTSATEQAVMVGSAFGTEQVDLDSLKARIQQNPAVLAQLEAYGSSIDDVVGISGTSESNVTIYVRG